SIDLLHARRIAPIRVHDVPVCNRLEHDDQTGIRMLPEYLSLRRDLKQLVGRAVDRHEEVVGGWWVWGGGCWDRVRTRNRTRARIFSRCFDSRAGQNCRAGQPPQRFSSRNLSHRYASAIIFFIWASPLMATLASESNKSLQMQVAAASSGNAL